MDAYNNCGKKVSYSQTITRYKEPPVFNTAEHSQCVANNPSKTFNINPVANASYYLWNTLPSGWSWSSGSTPTQLSASVNFNNVALKNNVCVQTVYPDGATLSLPVLIILHSIRFQTLSIGHMKNPQVPLFFTILHLVMIN